MNQDLTVNRIYSQCITPPREGPGGGRKTHLQVESLLPRLSTDQLCFLKFPLKISNYLLQENSAAHNVVLHVWCCLVHLHG